MANLGIFLGGLAQGMQKAQEQDTQDRLVGVRDKLAGLEAKKAENAQNKEILDRAVTNFKDIVASGKAIKQNAADPSQATNALGILRNRILTTGAMLAQIPGGTAAAQSALDQFDADVLGTPTAVEAGKVKGQATAAEVTAAQPAQTAAAVAKETALGPVQAQNAAATSAATTGAKLATEANFADVTAAKDAKIARATAQATADLKPQSNTGQQVADRLAFVNQYGENSPQVKAFDEANSQPNKAKLSDIAELRGQYTKLSNSFVNLRNYFSQIANASKDVSAAGDLSLIFGYMKMLDPTSVVREGEQASAQNAAGVPDRIMNVYNKVLRGERLNPAQRADFAHQAENIFRIQLENQRRVEDQYRQIAERHNMDPNDVVTDFIGPYRSALKRPSAGGATGGTAGVPKLGLDGSLQ